MTIVLLASCALVGLAAPKKLAPQIVSASMFKNGFAVVTRVMDIPSSGEYTLDSIPQASLGTLWFGSTNGVKIKGIVNTTINTTKPNTVGSIDELLTLNVGKTLRLGMKNGDDVTKTVISGKVLSANGAIVLVDTGKDTVAIPKASITSLAAVSGSLTTSSKATYGQRALRFVVDAPNAGKITMLSLERGMTWTPGYVVDITDPKKLKMVAKATISNDLADVDNIESKFVTGFPNLPYAFQLDPLVDVPQIGVPMAQGALNYGFSNGAFGGGGFGGRAGGQMAQNAAAPLEAADFAAAMDPSTLAGDQKGDLFFYKQPNVSLKKGDRAYYVLFQSEAEYTHLYTWDVLDNVVNDAEYRGIDRSTAQEFWHSVRFKNNAGQPLTTGSATTLKGGDLLGQDQIKYTPAGALTELKITKALDIRAEADEEETGRERQNLRLWNGVVYDLVTLKGTLSIINQKHEKVDVKVTKEITGELVDATNSPETTKIAKQLSAVNVRNRLVWTLPLEAGQAMKLNYTYKVYIRA